MEWKGKIIKDSFCYLDFIYQKRALYKNALSRIFIAVYLIVIITNKKKLEFTYCYISYLFFMCCVTQKRKCYEAMNIKGFSKRGSYTKYKIWVSEATA